MIYVKFFGMPETPQEQHPTCFHGAVSIFTVRFIIVTMSLACLSGCSCCVAGSMPCVQNQNVVDTRPR